MAGKESRAARAAATRGRILDAAYASFAADGYRATTMQAVADRAGVAVQTVYFVFHTKDDLLCAVQERAVIGDDRVPPPQQAELAAAAAEPDLRRAVELFVRGNLAILERVGPLIPTWHAVAGDPVGQVWRHLEELRYEGYGDLLVQLSARAPLRSGLSHRQATDLLFVLLGPELFRSLVNELGWPSETYAIWVQRTIGEQLFGLTHSD